MHKVKAMLKFPLNLRNQDILNRTIYLLYNWKKTKKFRRAKHLRKVAKKQKQCFLRKESNEILITWKPSIFNRFYTLKRQKKEKKRNKSIYTESYNIRLLK